MSRSLRAPLGHRQNACISKCHDGGYSRFDPLAMQRRVALQSPDHLHFYASGRPGESTKISVWPSSEGRGSKLLNIRFGFFSVTRPNLSLRDTVALIKLRSKRAGLYFRTLPLSG